MNIPSHSYFASVLVCVFGLGFGMPALAAATYTWSGGAGDDDWTKGANYEGGVAPVAGDTVTISDGLVARLSGADTGSWNLVSSLSAVKTKSTTARIEITVEGTEEKTLNCLLCGFDWQEKYHGTLVKLGTGALKFGNGGQSAYNYLNMRVEAGTLYLQQNATANCWFGNFYVASGATLYGINGSYRTFIGALTGDGDYKTLGNGELLTQGGTEDAPIVCNVRCTDCRLYQGGKYVFTNPGNRFGSVYTYNNGITDVASYSKTAGASPLGGAGTLYFAESGGGTYRFSGRAAETSDRAFEVKSGSVGASYIDAGHFGGLTLTGAWSMGGWADGMSQIVLMGSNTTESVFDGVVKGKTGLCFAFVKRGTGIWRLGATGSRTEMFSSTVVEEGRLRYDSILEKGDPSALGTASDTLEPYCGAYDETKKVDYAVLLGKPDISWPSERLATFDYSGTAKKGVTTRPIALQGDAAVMSSSAKLVWRGAWSNAGTNNLVLAGDATAFTNVFADVTDGAAAGARTGVVKDGAGTWMLTGTNSFTGPLVVNGGTLIARRPTSEYRWYRLVVRDSFIGAGYDYIKLGRVAFMNDKGVRQSCGLTFVSDHYENDSHPAYYYGSFNAVLEPGEFGWGAPLRTGSWQGRTMADICKDGECWDSSCLNFTRSSIKSSYLNEPMYWLYFDFRLPESADTVCYYDMALVYGTGSGSATSNYVVKAWSMNGSTDGIHWDKLHSVDDCRSEDPDQKMKQRWSANTWMASNKTTSNTKAADTVFDTEKLQPIASEDLNAASVPFLTTVEYVTVANGAVLDVQGDVTLSKFKAAYGATAGTVRGAKLAADCEIEVTGIPKGATSFEVPLNFEGAAPEDAEWTVKDGEKVSRRFEAVARDGKLTLIRRGSLIILR